jgi:hypothetical protein
MNNSEERLAGKTGRGSLPARSTQEGIVELQYSKSILFYRDKPQYGLFLKLILIIPVAFLVGSLYLWLSGETEGSLALLIEAFIIGLIFWVVFPREYQVYEDHLRIVMGGPFSVKVGFQDIKTIRITSRTALTVNFVTRITRNYVEIVKNKGWGIAITPADNELFVENANRALEQWLKTKRQTGVAPI